MHGAFDEEQLLAQQPQRDTEVTLGPFVIFLLVVGLALVCGLSYGLGYAVGRHAKPQATMAATPQPVSTTTTTASSHPKPPASAQSQRAASQPADSGTKSAATSPDDTQPVVRPALPAVGYAASPAPSQPTPRTEPQRPGTLMVQIAAVAHQEDADVLLGALRRRGYTVSVHRDPADGLLHVRLGPFNNRNEAGKWHDKLLNDGYNAIVQP